MGPGDSSDLWFSAKRPAVANLAYKLRGSSSSTNVGIPGFISLFRVNTRARVSEWTAQANAVDMQSPISRYVATRFYKVIKFIAATDRSLVPSTRSSFAITLPCVVVALLTWVFADWPVTLADITGLLSINVVIFTFKSNLSKLAYRKHSKGMGHQRIEAHSCIIRSNCQSEKSSCRWQPFTCFSPRTM